MLVVYVRLRENMLTGIALHVPETELLVHLRQLTVLCRIVCCLVPCRAVVHATGYLREVGSVAPARKRLPTCRNRGVGRAGSPAAAQFKLPP